MRTLRWLNPAAARARTVATPRRGLLAVGLAAVAALFVAGAGPGRAGNVDLLSAANVQLVGAAASDSAGYSVAGAGDVNNDGKADVLVGAYGADNNGRASSGSVYVVFGQTAQTRINLGSLGASGYRIDGAAANDQLGTSVANLGDVNGDKRPDVLVGAPNAGNNGRAGAGSAYVVFGKSAPATVDLAALGTQGYRIDGAAASDGAGANVAAAGDVNGDAIPDAVIGATGADNNGRTSSGSAYVVFGKAAPTTAIDLAVLGSQGFRLDGAVTGDFAGSGVAGVGDVNGDTKADVLVGAYGADNNARTTSGSAYLVFGKSSTAPVDLAALGAQGVRIDGAAAADTAGFSVAGPGDVNADGRPDLLLGAYGADNNARSS
jgi:hypothetical protein